MSPSQCVGYGVDCANGQATCGFSLRFYKKVLFHPWSSTAMSSFFALVSTPEHRGKRDRLFRHGLNTFRQAKAQIPSATVETDWASAAAFSRLNGSGGKLSSGGPAGTWLTAPGTWFHRSGIRSGDEDRLLQHYLEDGAETLAQ